MVQILILEVTKLKEPCNTLLLILGRNSNIVKLLLDCGVDVHCRDSDAATALLLAAKLGNS